MQTRLLRPEGTSLLRVLQVVSDDVGLLEEETHGVGQLGVLPHLWVLQLGRGEQLRQPDPYQPCHVVTILSGIKQNRNVGKHNETHGETNVVEEQRDAAILDCYIFIYFQIFSSSMETSGSHLPGPTPSWIPLSFPGIPPFLLPYGGIFQR